MLQKRSASRTVRPGMPSLYPTRRPSWLPLSHGFLPNGRVRNDYKSGSDGNFTAALGIPTIDGLGPIGGNAHSEREYGEVSSLAPRFELLCEIVAALTGVKKQ